MTWTYDPSLASPVDQVRLLIGDTLNSDQLLQDEEIQFFLDADANVNRVAAQCCKILAARFAREVDKQVGDLKIWASQKQKQYLALQEEQSAKAAMLSGTPMAGGVYTSEKTTMEERGDVVQPFFRRGMHDYD